MFLVKALGFARDKPCSFAGQFLEWYDPDADENGPIAAWTSDLDKAKKFETTEDALAEWHRVRTVDPVRPDGKPNKPLTAISIEIVPIDWADVPRPEGLAELAQVIQIPTKERLARRLEYLGAPILAEYARGGLYSDFESDLPTPKVQLLIHLEALGLHGFAEEVRRGKWDDTREEADAWAAAQTVETREVIDSITGRK